MKLMSNANKNCIFLHCLPRGKEVHEKVFSSKISKVWQQAINRVHVQKSILLYSFGKLSKGKGLSEFWFKYKIAEALSFLFESNECILVPLIHFAGLIKYPSTLRKSMVCHMMLRLLNIYNLLHLLFYQQHCIKLDQYYFFPMQLSDMLHIFKNFFSCCKIT